MLDKKTDRVCDAMTTPRHPAPSIATANVVSPTSDAFFVRRSAATRNKNDSLAQRRNETMSRGRANEREMFWRAPQCRGNIKKWIFTAARGATRRSQMAARRQGNFFPFWRSLSRHAKDKDESKRDFAGIYIMKRARSSAGK